MAVKFMYVGDIMASPGRHLAMQLVPKLREQHNLDFVIAQAENVTHGKSMSPAHMRELQACGIDFFTGGNHTTKRPDIHAALADPRQPVICPVNLLETPDEWGVKTFTFGAGRRVLVVSLLGQTFPNSLPIKNPLQAFNDILGYHSLADYAAIVVNFHGDFSSEKRVIGYYADGRVSGLFGDHWHVPTADAMVLPKGTAHITDVGMVGTLHSSLGVSLDAIVKRWRDGKTNVNTIDTTGPFQFNAVVVTLDERTHLATKIEQINQVVEKIA